MAQGADLTPEDEQFLRKQIIEQSKQLDALKRQMAETDAKLLEMQRILNKEKLRTTRATGTTPPQGGTSPSFDLAQAPQAQPKNQPETVGQPEERSRVQQIAQIFEQPGVLTPRGKFMLEPGLQYGYSSSNRVSLVGYTIIPAILIGLIDVKEVKRNTFTPSLTARWGITNRLELEAKLPYVYRDDTVVSRPLNLGAARDEVFNSTGSGIGDFEMTGRYQLNEGGVDNPYYIATMRFKSRTGKDPFEVETDTLAPGRISNELQRELPTGSGFYTLQPGLTVLYPSDPAVFFGGISYQYNIKRSGVSMNTTNGPVAIGEVEPGSVLGFNFGMGLALNDRSSFSIGYDHASVGATKINGTTAVNSVRTELGTLLLGYSHRLNKSTSLNVSVGAGVTRDTPDVQLSVRLPMTF
ncbi:acetate kinase [Dechloromonas denitrificans]|uniref:Acetate kinase n=2 Tax=Dechloromonas denitrificans TaxID=281362 RepID=A0A133XPB0_9RHOO|nr:acetate kinase [Dechloromonas denitrificans]